ncbi:MAG TPA: glycosyltransferase 87 family protein [Opitutaceae bacterium]
MTPSAARPAHWRWLLLASLVAATLFFHRGVARALDRGLRDFAGPFAGTRVFWTGGNPYDAAVLLPVLERAGASDKAPPPAVYPAATFVALAPFAVLPAHGAKLLFLGAGLLLLGIGVRGWARELQLSATQTGLLCALILAGSHLHTALFVANPGLVAVGALLAGTWCYQRQHNKTAFALLLWSLLLKPQLGIVGLLWLLVQKRLRPALALTLVSGAIAAASIGYLHWREPAALAQWQANAKAEHSSGSISATGSLGVHRVDPAGLWAAFTGRDLASPVQAATAAGYALLALFVARRAAASMQPGASLAILGVAALLASYHRAYDAVLLIPAWLVLAAPGVNPALRIVSALVCALWILPGGGFWTTLAGSYRFIPEWLVGSAFNQLVLARLQAWALLATAVILLLGLLRRAQAKSVSPA